MELSCKVCKKKIRVKPSRVNERGGNYCSRKCFYGRPQKNSRISLTCKTCKKNFMVYPSRKKTGKKYCSKNCYTKDMKGRKAWNRGIQGKDSHTYREKHWNWQGGISGEDYLERRKFRRNMQKQIFERDNYTCQLCGIRGINLQVDHIQSWSEYVEERFSMDNCRTLCANCHYNITFRKPMPKKIKAWGHNLLERERITT